VAPRSTRPTRPRRGVSNAATVGGTLCTAGGAVLAGHDTKRVAEQARSTG
jgi:hypothetical protein